MESKASPVSVTPLPHRWLALGALLFGSFMVLLDTSIVTNGLATIQRDLGATYSEVQFVLTAYSVAYGILLVTGGRLGDLFGRRRVFLIGLLGFTVFSALCGLASSALLLIILRIAQGMSGALLFPQVSSYIQVLFPGDERPRAFGMQGAIIGLGIVAGPLLGGILIDANLFGSLWRPIFLVNVPLGIAALIFASRVLPESRVSGERQLDGSGVVLLAITLFALIFPIIQGRDAGWPAWLVILLVASIPLFGIFLIQQLQRIQRQEIPLIQLSLFRNRAFTIGTIITLLFQSSVLSFFVTMSLFFQAGLGYSPTKAAVTLITYQIAIAVGSLLSPGLSKRFGRVLLWIGFGLLTTGLVAQLIILNATALTYHGFELIPALVISGLGFGFVVAPLQTIILGGVNPVFAGSASGLLSTVQQIGSALGVALIGVILFGQLAVGANTASAQVVPQITKSLTAIHIPTQFQQAIITQFTLCFYDRSRQQDPSAVPASCHQTDSALPKSLAPAINSTISQAAQHARATNFLDAALITLRYQLVIYTLCFALTWFLPGKVHPTGLSAAQRHAV